MVMKIEFDLKLIEVGDDYWSETVADIIKNVVIEEVAKATRKMVREELKKLEKEVQNHIAQLTSIKIKEALKDIKV